MASQAVTSAIPANWDSLILHEIDPTGNEIGRGAYGRVFEVNYEGTVCAAKEVHELLLQSSQGDDLQKIKDNFLSECQIWSTLRHPRVVQFLGVYYPEKVQYKLPVMIMEKMQYSLKNLMEKYDNIPLNVKLSILDEVCLGLRYLHTRNPPIVHRDLTPNNILLGYHLEAKISDLGVAKVMQTTDARKMIMTKAPGAVDFMPPECLVDNPVYGLPLDIFSYGGVILYTITHQWPQPSSWVKFDPNTDRKMVLSEVERRQRYLDEMTGDAADLKPLVASCLSDNPKNRPPVTQVSLTIKMLKDVCSQKSDHDGMSPIVWWAEVCNEQQSPAISSLTASLEEMTLSNEQLRRELNVFKADNTQLTTALKKINSNIENQVQQINSQCNEIDAMKEEIEQLKATNYQLKQQLAQKKPRKLFNGPMNIKWEDGAPAPVQCALHTAVWLDNLVYVGGSFEPGWKDSYTIYCYDPVGNSWNSHINTPYCYFAMTVLNGNLLIVGGRDRNDKKTNQILTMDGGQLANYTKMNTARLSPTAVGHQGMLIITGGVDDKNKTLSSTELYDSGSGNWHTCSKLPQPHYRLQSVIVDNTLYLLGGYNNDGVSPAVFTAPLDSLTKHQLKWNTHQDTLWYHSAPVGVCGKHLLIVGGDNEIDNEFVLTSNIYKFNKTSQSWEVIGKIPSERESLAAVSTTDNKIIVIGGRDDRELCTNTVWIGSCEPLY